LGGSAALQGQIGTNTIQAYNILDGTITGAKIAASTIKSNNITNAAFGGNG
jgi:hypothetical protein